MSSCEATPSTNHSDRTEDGEGFSESVFPSSGRRARCYAAPNANAKKGRDPLSGSGNPSKILAAFAKQGRAQTLWSELCVQRADRTRDDCHCHIVTVPHAPKRMFAELDGHDEDMAIHAETLFDYAKDGIVNFTCRPGSEGRVGCSTSGSLAMRHSSRFDCAPSLGAGMHSALKGSGLQPTVLRSIGATVQKGDSSSSNIVFRLRERQLEFGTYFPAG